MGTIPIYVILTLLLLLHNKEILALLIGGKTNVLSNQMRGSGFLLSQWGATWEWRALGVHALTLLVPF
jgi:hypothetical protein